MAGNQQPIRSAANILRRLALTLHEDGLTEDGLSIHAKPIFGYAYSMRACLSFLLAIMLSLNATYAASVDVCDVLEHTSSHAAHLGHHSHEHSDHAHDGPQVSADNAGKAASVSDHHHDHVHPSFFSILPGIIGVTPLIGHSPMIATPAGIFVSAPQALPARPPRATLA